MRKVDYLTMKPNGARCSGFCCQADRSRPGQLITVHSWHALTVVALCLLVTLLSGCIGISDEDKAINLVYRGKISSNDKITVGEAFASNFDNPEWSLVQTDFGDNVVEVKGYLRAEDRGDSLPEGTAFIMQFLLNSSLTVWEPGFGRLEVPGQGTFYCDVFKTIGLMKKIYGDKRGTWAI